MNPPLTEKTPGMLAMDTWRCRTCGRILAQVHLTPGSMVRIKCGGCNTIGCKGGMPVKAVLTG